MLKEEVKAKKIVFEYNVFDTRQPSYVDFYH